MGKGVAGRETSLNLCQPMILLPVRLQMETSENLETLCPVVTSTTPKLHLLTMLYHACNISTDTHMLGEITTITYMRALQDKPKY